MYRSMKFLRINVVFMTTCYTSVCSVTNFTLQFIVEKFYISLVFRDIYGCQQLSRYNYAGRISVIIYAEC